MLKPHFAALALAVALFQIAPNALAVCTPMPECQADEHPPSVSLTSPANGAVATAPASFTLSADAGDIDPGGTVQAVEFFVNGTSVGIDSSAPYSMSYGGLAAGSYTITAKATDDTGLSTTSAGRTVTVNPPGNVAPTVTMTAPANNSTATAPASLVLSATATDSDGTIAKVDFKSGTTVLNSDTTYPYSFTYSSVQVGTYTFTAVATDNNGAATTSSPVTVTVNAASNAPPTVSLTAPANNSSYAWGSPILMASTAADSDGTITKVQFLSNGAVVGEDTTSPYSYTYAPTSGGSKALTAVAYDNTGSSTTSNVMNVTVAAPAQVSETRIYVYDANHRLCKTINPESGSTVIMYGTDGNILWTADGQALPSTTQCNQDQVPINAQTSRTYDAMNRVTAVHTPGAVADVLTDYWPDGAIKKLTASNPGGNVVTNEYEYNNRRLLTKETQTNFLQNVPNTTVVYVVTYGYTANAHLKSIGYPDSEVVDYAPDGLGRPTQVVGTSSAYATGISYYPNGAMSGFKYGSAAAGGPSHEMFQNARQLPARSHDFKGTSQILDDTYSYDANGNVTDIVDAAQTGNASQTRGMAYDDLDRLTAAVGPWGNATYSYDALDNLRSADQGTRQFRYVYDANWHLQAIKNPAGTQLYSFTYDTQGNTRSKNSQVFVFDSSNRVSSATTTSGTSGTQSYRYDGMGRRVQTTDPGTSNPPLTYWLYTQAGQVLYTYEGRRSQSVSYIYLNGSQIATRTKPSGAATVRFQMTDALGSPVASTGLLGASIQRTSFNPWGEATPSVDGTGYTGHVMDANTGLTYMQQRYFDPLVARFVSIDPIPESPQVGANFNRYAYANLNPFHYTDPDGRFGACNETSGGCDMGSFTTVDKGEADGESADKGTPDIASQARYNRNTALASVGPSHTSFEDRITMLLAQGDWEEAELLLENSAGEVSPNVSQAVEAASQLGRSGYTRNALNHVFVEKHHLGNLVSRLGSEEVTMLRIHEAAQSITGVNGQIFSEGVQISVNGTNLFVRGRIIGGVFRVATAFIP